MNAAVREPLERPDAAGPAADAVSEHRAVLQGAGVVERADLAHLRLWGRDPVKMLHGLITNDLLAATPERAVYAVMLTPKGRVITELRARVVRAGDADEVWVDLPREGLPEATAHLRKFVPPMFARWEDASERVGVIGVYGPDAARIASRALGAEVEELAEDAAREHALAGRRVRVVGTRYTGGPGLDLFADAEALPALREALLREGARPVSADTLETLRIEAGRPRTGHELTEETIPTEAFESTGLMPRAISFTKGCYTGQEVIVRIAHRGHVNRHLRGLLLGEAALPDAGTPLHHPETGREVGRITSAARSPRMRQAVALGFVRRELEPGARVRVGAPEGGEAVVVALPFGTEG